MPQRSLENVRPVPISLHFNSAHLTDDLDALREAFACTNAEEYLSDMYAATEDISIAYIRWLW